MVDMLVMVYILELIMIGSDRASMVSSNMEMVWIFVDMGDCVVGWLGMVYLVRVRVVAIRMMHI